MKALYYRETEPQEILAIENDEIRLFMREWNHSYLITLNNKLGEEVIFSIQAEELYGKEEPAEEIQQEERKRRERAINTIIMLFLDYPEEALLKKIEQFIKLSHWRGIQLQTVSFVDSKFKKRKIYPKCSWFFNPNKVFTVGSHDKNVKTNILK